MGTQLLFEILNRHTRSEREYLIFSLHDQKVNSHVVTYLIYEFSSHGGRVSYSGVTRPPLVSE